jgi:hypothetical protein
VRVRLSQALLGCAGVVAASASCRPARSAPPSAAAVALPVTTSDPAIQADNDRVVQQMLTKLGPRQTEPSDKVFVNISVMPGIPARQFLSIMNGGYAKALGVRCVHCHVETDFASDEKRPKRAAREMAVMHRMINQQLRGMKDIATPPTENRAINCATCHRGMVDPRKGP